MAKDIILDVYGNTRPLTRQLEKDIGKFSRSHKFNLNDKNFSQPLGRITGQVGEFDKALEASNARVLAFAASAGVLYAVQKGFQAVFHSMVNVEKKLADINVLFGASEKNLNKFSSGLFNVAKQTGQGFNEVAEAATELARQGLSAEETLKRTRDALILTRLTGMDAAEAVSAVTAALNSFSRAAIDSTEYVSKLAAVDAAFAVGSDDLAAAVSRVGSSAQEAGVSIDQLIAIVTSAQQITARGGAVIGNSFKTIFTRIQRPKVLNQLRELGIGVDDVAGGIRPAISILKELAGTYDTLAQSQQAQIAELIGGVFQVNVLKASLRDLGKEFSLYGNALKISTNATDEAIRRNEELNKTVSASLNQVVQHFTKFGAQAGESLLGPLTRRVSGITDYLFKDTDLKQADNFGSKLAKGVFGAIGKFLSSGGLIIGIKVLFNAIREFSKYAIEGVSKLSGSVGQSQKQFQLQQAIGNEMQKHPELINQLISGEVSAAKAADKLYISLKQSTRELNFQKDLVESLAKNMARRGVGIGPAPGDVSIDPRSFGASSGFIPNFANSEDAINAAVELSSASYTKPTSRAIKTKIEGVGSVMTNSEEKIVQHPSFKQPFVNPPISSSEGRLHRKRSKEKTGVDPYAFGGFVPNFRFNPNPENFQSALNWYYNQKKNNFEDFRSSNELASEFTFKAGMNRNPKFFHTLNKSGSATKQNLAQAYKLLNPNEQGNNEQIFSKLVNEFTSSKSKFEQRGLDRIKAGGSLEESLERYLNATRSSSDAAIDFTHIGAEAGVRALIGMEPSYTVGDAYSGDPQGHGAQAFTVKVMRHNAALYSADKARMAAEQGQDFNFGELPAKEIIGTARKDPESVLGSFENASFYMKLKSMGKKARTGGTLKSWEQLDSGKWSQLQKEYPDLRVKGSYDKDLISEPALYSQLASMGFIPNFLETDPLSEEGIKSTLKRIIGTGSANMGKIQKENPLTYAELLGGDGPSGYDFDSQHSSRANKIINLYKDRISQAKNESEKINKSQKEVIFSAGGGGSGKTFTLQKLGLVDTKDGNLTWTREDKGEAKITDYLPKSASARIEEVTSKGRVYINSDDIKGLLPQYQDLLKLKHSGAAGVVHEESSSLAKRITGLAASSGADIVYDAVLGGDKADFIKGLQERGEAFQGHLTEEDLNWVGGQKNKLKESLGYKGKIVAVLTPIENALQQAANRAKKTGRNIDPIHITHGHKSFLQNVLSNMRATSAEDFRDPKSGYTPEDTDLMFRNLGISKEKEVIASEKSMEMALLGRHLSEQEREEIIPRLKIRSKEDAEKVIKQRLAEVEKAERILTEIRNKPESKRKENALGGFVPNFIKTGLKYPEADYKDPEAYRYIASTDERGREVGSLTFRADQKSNRNKISFNASDKKGAGFSQFKFLTDLSRGQGRSMYSGLLESQISKYRSYNRDQMMREAEETKLKSIILQKHKDNYSALTSKYFFPQIRHRMQEGLATRGDFSNTSVEHKMQFPFRTLRELRGKVNPIPRLGFIDSAVDDDIGLESLESDFVKEGELDDNFRKGFVPNFNVADYAGNDPEMLLGGWDRVFPDPIENFDNGYMEPRDFGVVKALWDKFWKDYINPTFSAGFSSLSHGGKSSFREQFLHFADKRGRRAPIFTPKQARDAAEKKSEGKNKKTSGFKITSDGFVPNFWWEGGILETARDAVKGKLSKKRTIRHVAKAVGGGIGGVVGNELGPIGTGAGMWAGAEFADWIAGVIMGEEPDLGEEEAKKAVKDFQKNNVVKLDARKNYYTKNPTNKLKKNLVKTGAVKVSGNQWLSILTENGLEPLYENVAGLGDLMELKRMAAAEGFIPNFAKFDPLNPPSGKGLGARGIPAFELARDSSRHYDEQSKTHGDLIKNLGFLSKQDEIFDLGWIKDGKWNEASQFPFDKKLVLGKDVRKDPSSPPNFSDRKREKQRERMGVSKAELESVARVDGLMHKHQGYIPNFVKPETLNKIKSSITSSGGELYTVGGSVRDKLISKDNIPKDVDYVVRNINLNQIEKSLSPLGKVNTVGKSFGVVTANIDGNDFDFAIPRTKETKTGEGHGDFSVETDPFASIESDLGRRDFTMNAIAEAGDGSLIDPFGGKKDIENKLIKAVGNPDARLQEDPLRILRALQFAQRFNFDVDKETLNAMTKHREELNSVSNERIREEFIKGWTKGKGASSKFNQLLSQTGIGTTLFGSGFKPSSINSNSVAENYTAAFLSGGDPSKMSPTNEMAGMLSAAKSIRSGKSLHSVKGLREKSDSLINVFNQLGEKDISDAITTSLSKPLGVNELKINGKDILDLGYQGPKIGEIQRQLFEQVYSGDLANDREELLNRIKSGNFNKGFIPNFIKTEPIEDDGISATLRKQMMLRNTSQIKWMRDQAQKTGKDLNNTDYFTELAKKYALLYPNDQMLFDFQSRGYIPNFNTALKDAVNREHGAGIPKNKIKVDSDHSLKTKENPLGLGVYNTKQESSLKQGIGFARQSGIDPKTKGKSEGFVPNFVKNKKQDRAPKEGIEFQGKKFAGGQFMPEGSLDTALFTSINSILKEVLSSASVMNESMGQAVVGLSEMRSATESTIAQLKESNNHAKSMSDSMSSMSGGIKSMSSDVGKMSSGIEQANSGIAGLSETSKKQLTLAREGIALQQTANTSLQKSANADEKIATVKEKRFAAEQEAAQAAEEEAARLSKSKTDAGASAIGALQKNVSLRGLGSEKGEVADIGVFAGTDEDTAKVGKAGLEAAIKAAEESTSEYASQLDSAGIGKALNAATGQFEYLPVSAENLADSLKAGKTSAEIDALVNSLNEAGQNVNYMSEKAPMLAKAIEHAEKNVKESKFKGVAKSEPINLSSSSLGEMSLDETMDADRAVSARMRELEAQLEEKRKALDEGTKYDYKNGEMTKIQTETAKKAAEAIDDLKEEERKLQSKTKKVREALNEKVITDMNSSIGEVEAALGELGKNASSMDFKDLLKHEQKKIERDSPGRTGVLGRAATKTQAFGKGIKSKLFEEDDATGKFQQKMFYLSAGISTVSGMMDSWGEEGSTLNKSVSGLTEGVNTATGLMTTLPGPWGKMVGIAAGVGVAMDGVLKAFAAGKGSDFLGMQGLNVEGLKKKADQSKEKFTKLQNNITAYANAFAELKDAAKDFNTPAEQIARLNKKLEDLIASVPAEFAADLAAINDPAELQAKVAEIIAEQQKKAAGIEYAAQTAERASGSVGWQNAWGIGGNESRNQFEGAQGGVAANRAATDLSANIDFKKLQEGLDSAAGGANKLNADQLLAANSSTELANILQTQYGATEEMANAIRSMNSGEMQILRKRLVDMANAARRSREALEKIGKVRARVSSDLDIDSLTMAVKAAEINVDQEKKEFMASGGGIEGFMNPKSMDELANKFEAAMERAIAPETKPGAAGASVGLGRSFAGIVEGLNGLHGIMPKLNKEGALQDDWKEMQNVIAKGMSDQAKEMDRKALANAMEKLNRARASGAAPEQLKGLEFVVTQLDKRLSDPKFYDKSSEAKAREFLGLKEVERTMIQLPSAIAGSLRAGETLETTMSDDGISAAVQAATIEQANEGLADELVKLKKRLTDLQKDGVDQDEQEEVKNLTDAINSMEGFTVSGASTAQELGDLKTVDSEGQARDFFEGGKLKLGADMTPTQRALMDQQKKLREATEELTRATREAAEDAKNEQSAEILKEGQDQLVKLVARTQKIVTAKGSDTAFSGIPQAEINQAGMLAQAIQEQAGNLGIMGRTEFGRADRAEAAVEFIAGERTMEGGINSAAGLVEAMRLVSDKMEKSIGREASAADLETLALGMLTGEDGKALDEKSMRSVLQKKLNISDTQATALLEKIYNVFKNQDEGPQTIKLLESVVKSTSSDQPFKPMNDMAAAALDRGSIYVHDTHMEKLMNQQVSDETEKGIRSNIDENAGFSAGPVEASITAATLLGIRKAWKSWRAPKDAVKTADAATDVVKTADAATDLAKVGNAATDAATDVVKTADAATDVVKTADAATDVVKTADATTDVVKTADAATDVVKTADAATDLAKVGNAATDAAKGFSSLGKLGKGLVVTDLALLGLEAYNLATNFEGVTSEFEQLNASSSTLGRAWDGFTSPLTATATAIKMVGEISAISAENEKTRIELIKKSMDQEKKATSNMEALIKATASAEHAMSGINNKTLSAVISSIVKQKEQKSIEEGTESSVQALKESGGLSDVERGEIRNKMKNEAQLVAGSLEAGYNESKKKTDQIETDRSSLLQFNRVATTAASTLGKDKEDLSAADVMDFAKSTGAMSDDSLDRVKKIFGQRGQSIVETDFKVNKETGGTAIDDILNAMGLEVNAAQEAGGEAFLAKVRESGVSIEEVLKKLEMTQETFMNELTNAPAQFSKQVAQVIATTKGDKEIEEKSAKKQKLKEEFSEQVQTSKFDAIGGLDILIADLEEKLKSGKGTEEDQANLAKFKSQREERINAITNVRGERGDVQAAELNQLFTKLDSLKALSAADPQNEKYLSQIKSLEASIASYQKDIGGEKSSKSSEAQKAIMNALKASGRSGAAKVMGRNIQGIQGLNEELKELETSDTAEDAVVETREVEGKEVEITKEQKRQELLAKREKLLADQKNLVSEAQKDPKYLAALQRQQKTAEALGKTDSRPAMKPGLSLLDDAQMASQQGTGVLGERAQTVTPVLVTNWPTMLGGGSMLGGGAGPQQEAISPVVRAMHNSLGSSFSAPYANTIKATEGGGGGGIGGFLGRSRASDIFTSASSNLGYQQQISQLMGGFDPFGGPRNVGVGPMTALDSPLPTKTQPNVPMRIEGLSVLNTNLANLNETLRTAFLGSENAGNRDELAEETSATEETAQVAQAAASQPAEADTNTEELMNVVKALHGVLVDSHARLTKSFDSLNIHQQEQFQLFVEGLSGIVERLTGGSIKIGGDAKISVQHAGTLDIGGDIKNKFENDIKELNQQIIGLGGSPRAGTATPAPPAGGQAATTQT